MKIADQASSIKGVADYRESISSFENIEHLKVSVEFIT
jgi:hypothetical protein